MASRYLTVLLVAVALLSLPGSAWAGGGHGEWEQTVDGYHVGLVIREPVTPGNVPLEVMLSRDGMAVDNAAVQLAVELKVVPADAHGEAPADAHSAVEAADSHPEAEGAHSGAGDAHNNPEASHTGQSEVPHTDSVAEPHDEGATDAHEATAEHEHPDSLVFALGANSAPGIYAGSIILTETGQWAVTVHFAIDGKAHVVDFLVDVVPVDRGASLLAVFVGLNTTIMGTAAFLKRKSPPASTAPGATA
jgi:hypothetical protein